MIHRPTKAAGSGQAPEPGPELSSHLFPHFVLASMDLISNMLIPVARPVVP